MSVGKVDPRVISAFAITGISLTLLCNSPLLYAAYAVALTAACTCRVGLHGYLKLVRGSMGFLLVFAVFLSLKFGVLGVQIDFKGLETALVLIAKALLIALYSYTAFRLGGVYGLIPAFALRHEPMAKFTLAITLSLRYVNELLRSIETAVTSAKIRNPRFGLLNKSTMRAIASIFTYSLARTLDKAWRIQIVFEYRTYRLVLRPFRKGLRKFHPILLIYLTPLPILALW